MTSKVPETPRGTWEPRWPTLAATGAFAFWIAILSLPMWSGKFLGGPASDQYASGYALRKWAAEQWRQTGQIPLWNPEIFGGLPFVGAMHGDIFYPTAWLRLGLPTAIAMDLGFVVHYVLAGLFLYVFLRLLGVSWGGSVTGGLAYQLSGVVVSYAFPGHDGKLFVTALFPLGLAALLLALRRERAEGLALAAIVVGLGVLSPHPQMLYYMLVASGLFALYLTFGEPTERPLVRRLLWLGGALVAVALGVGIGAIQVLPFLDYTPYSPRAETYRGWEGATSYAIPWHHLPEFLFADFVGHGGRYWGGNPLKYHSEYLGLPVLALAALGALSPPRRRLVWWLGGIALLFLLIALGAGTPFYRVWYEVMPYMKQVRAAGMALYIVALVVAVWAAFGVERLERDEGAAWGRWWLAAGAVVAALALVGGIPAFAESLALGVEGAPGRPTVAKGAAGAIRLGAVVSGLALVALGAVAWLRTRRRIASAAFALVVALIISADLWRNGTKFWAFTDVEAELYAPDPLIESFRAAGSPLRVMNFTETQLEVYPSNVLMAHSVSQLLGHHGNQIHRFNELLGGRNQWRYLFASTRLWDLYAVRYALLPAGFQPQPGQLPGFLEGWRKVRENVTTATGTVADLWERTAPQPWVRVVPAAAKVSDDQAIPLVADPRSPLSFDRLIVLDSAADHAPAPVDSLPPALAVRATVTAWEPGSLRIRLEPAPAQQAYALIAENWYPDWAATVDGEPAPVLRGNVSLLTVPVPAGARELALTFASASYDRGKAVSFASLGVVLLGLVAPGLLRRRRA